MKMDCTAFERNTLKLSRRLLTDRTVRQVGRRCGAYEAGTGAANDDAVCGPGVDSASTGQRAGERSADVRGTELLRPGGDVVAEIQPLSPLPQALGKLYRESLPPLRGKIAVSGRTL